MSHKDAGFWKGMAVTFLFGICLGIGMANLLPAENLKQHSKITVLLENGMGTESMETRFLWIFPLRMRLLLIWILAGCAAPFLEAAALTGMAAGWCVGMYAGSAILAEGSAGGTLAAAALLPQVFLYGAAICRILKTGWYRERGRKRKEGSFFLGITQAAGIYLLGILTESILNPAVLQTFLGML